MRVSIVFARRCCLERWQGCGNAATGLSRGNGLDTPYGASLGTRFGSDGSGAQPERAGANGGLQDQYRLKNRCVSHLTHLLCADTLMLNPTRDRAAMAPG